MKNANFVQNIYHKSLFLPFMSSPKFGIFLKNVQLISIETVFSFFCKYSMNFLSKLAVVLIYQVSLQIGLSWTKRFSHFEVGHGRQLIGFYTYLRLSHEFMQELVLSLLSPEHQNLSYHSCSQISTLAQNKRTH